MFTYEKIRINLSLTSFEIEVGNNFYEEIHFTEFERKKYIRLFSLLVESAFLNASTFLAYYHKLKYQLEQEFYFEEIM